MTNDVIIKSTHRGLRYEDGRLTGVLEAGRYEVPERRPGRRGGRRAVVEIVVVDMRERELTIKGQEILTSDKVAIRVSILTQFQVVDPVAAVEKVVSYEDRLYSDIQLAARRALASMTLEQILTSRNQLSEDILSDVTDAAAGYGVKVLRADVKDLIFPGNLQEIMNRVLTAERLSEAQLVEARTKAEREEIEARPGPRWSGWPPKARLWCRTSGPRLTRRRCGCRPRPPPSTQATRPCCGYASWKRCLS